MKILAFAASISPVSINNQLIHYAASVIKEKISPQANIEFLDLNDYMMPFYRPDVEETDGVPQLAHNFRAKISEADVIMISFAEHNGSYSAAYKNTFDWASRIDVKVYQNKPTILLATSPGRGGASNVLAMAVKSAEHFGMDVLGNLSVPSFNHSFDKENNQLTDIHLDAKLLAILESLKDS
ncbi:MAG: NAD(P)H-dependent oxidoreductase [Gammaproteobacteria bacterium]|nr:NAD(P)H-dependent oxidoreductase [Gammaproteobacteria bacterium]